MPDRLPTVWLTPFTSNFDPEEARFKAVEEGMAKQMAMLHSRTDRLETKIQYMPTPQQMSELQGDMQAMQATQEAIQRDITTVRISQNRIEDFLLKK